MCFGHKCSISAGLFSHAPHNTRGRQRLPLLPPFSFDTHRVRACLHLVLCFSPVGDAFRQRLRMFPSLVNCTTIDWFNNWPLEALKSVARSFCADLELAPSSTSGGSAEGDDAMLEGVLAACVHIHQSVEAKSKRYYEELRRCVFCVCTHTCVLTCGWHSDTH